MKSRRLLLLAGALTLMVSSCTIRLVDFTVISSKSHELGFDKREGKRVEGSATYFLNIGFNLKDALDDALEQAGPEYDLLIDGVVTYSSYPFVTVIGVKGIAVSSRNLRASLGEEGFEKWCLEQNVFDPNLAELPQESDQKG